jgi:hypothetical protein
VCVNLVAHQGTPIVERDKNYPKPNLYKVKGGGSWSDTTDNLLFVWRQNRNTNKQDTSVIVGSEKIKKQMLVGFPGDIDLEFNRASNRYNEPGQPPPLGQVSCDTIEPNEFETGQINYIPF